MVRKTSQVELALKLWFTSVGEQDTHVDGDSEQKDADFVTADRWIQEE